MATEKAIAIRQQQALDRIAEATGIDTQIQARNPGIGQAILLERIADAAEEIGPAGEPASLRDALSLYTAKEIEELPGVGPKTAEEIADWAQGEG